MTRHFSSTLLFPPHRPDQWNQPWIDSVPCNQEIDSGDQNKLTFMYLSVSLIITIKFNSSQNPELTLSAEINGVWILVSF